MKAKTINENVDDLFQGKSEDEIMDMIGPKKPIPAEYLVKLINAEQGYSFKANWTGAWDKFGPIESARVIEINVGKGFESGILVNSIEGGSFIYLPGFILSICLTLVFFASGLWFFRKMESEFADVI